MIGEGSNKFSDDISGLDITCECDGLVCEFRNSKERSDIYVICFIIIFNYQHSKSWVG